MAKSNRIIHGGRDSVIKTGMDCLVLHLSKKFVTTEDLMLKSSISRRQAYRYLTSAESKLPVSYVAGSGMQYEGSKGHWSLDMQFRKELVERISIG